MDEGLSFDRETGEIPISEKAIAANAKGLAIERELELCIGNYEINSAILSAVEKLPIWIKAEAKGNHAKYAKLHTILHTVRPVLLAEKIRIRQGASRSWSCDEGGGIKGRLIPVFTDLIHVPSGQVERTEFEVPLVKLDPQAMGSAITYGKRWTLLAGLGLATDEADDDGEAATLKSINEAHTDSPELAAMTVEMSAKKDATALAEWANDSKSKKRYSQLSDVEQAIIRQRKAERIRELLAEPVEAKKKKAGE